MILNKTREKKFYHVRENSGSNYKPCKCYLKEKKTHNLTTTTIATLQKSKLYTHCILIQLLWNEQQPQRNKNTVCSEYRKNEKSFLLKIKRFEEEKKNGKSEIDSTIWMQISCPICQGSFKLLDENILMIVHKTRIKRKQRKFNTSNPEYRNSDTNRWINEQNKQKKNDLIISPLNLRLLWIRTYLDRKKS